MKLCTFIIALLFIGCGRSPLLPEEPEEILPQFKELTPQNLRGQWVNENKRVRIFLEDGQSFHKEYHINRNVRGVYWIVGEYVGVSGIYNISSLMTLRTLLETPQKEFYKATLTDSTLTLMSFDNQFLSKMMSLSDEEYNADFSPEFIQKVLANLQEMDFSDNSKGISSVEEYLSWEYFGNRIYAMQVRQKNVE